MWDVGSRSGHILFFSSSCTTISKGSALSDSWIDRSVDDQPYSYDYLRVLPSGTLVARCLCRVQQRATIHVRSRVRTRSCVMLHMGSTVVLSTHPVAPSRRAVGSSSPPSSCGPWESRIGGDGILSIFETSPRPWGGGRSP